MLLGMAENPMPIKKKTKGNIGKTKMKSTIGKLALAVLALAFVHTSTFAAEEKDSGAEPASAVMCDKCTTVWVKVAEKNHKRKVIRMSKEKKMACKDCQSAVETFFTTGKLKHECATCGGTMSHCEAH